MKALRSVRDECACGAGRGWEGLGRRGWKGKGRRERKSFKDQGTAVGAIFSFPVKLCSLTELTGSRHRKVGHHNGGQVKRARTVVCPAPWVRPFQDRACRIPRRILVGPGTASSSRVLIGP